MTYKEMKVLLTGIASRSKVVGFDLVEVNPFLDSVGLTQSAAVMIILEFLGAIFKPTFLRAMVQPGQAAKKLIRLRRRLSSEIKGQG